MTTRVLGRVAPLYKGNYSNSTNYIKFDVVFDGESSFISKQGTAEAPNVGNALTDETWWGLLCKGNYLAIQPLTDSVTQLRSDLKCFKRGTVVLGNLVINSTAATVNLTGEYVQLFTDDGVMTVNNRNTDVAYDVNSPCYIHLKSNVLTATTTLPASGYLICIIYGGAIYDSISNRTILLNGKAVEYTPTYIDSLITSINTAIAKMPKLKRADIVLGGLYIDSVALTMNLAGANVYLFTEDGLISVDNKNTSISISGISGYGYIYVLNKVLTITQAPPTSGYLIGIYYKPHSKVYFSISEYNIYIDGKSLGVTESTVDTKITTATTPINTAIAKMPKVNYATIALGTLKFTTTTGYTGKLKLEGTATSQVFTLKGNVVITNYNVDIPYNSTMPQYIYIDDGVLKVTGNYNLLNASIYFIGIFYYDKLYHTLSNRNIQIDGVNFEMTGKEIQDYVSSIVSGPNYSILTPATLYLLNTKSAWIYTKNIIKDGFAMPNHLYLEANATGRSITNIQGGDYARVIINGDLLTGSVTLNLVSYIKQQRKILATKNMNVTCKALPTGKTINTILIGDSFCYYTYGSGILKGVQDLALADGNNVVFKGSINSNNGVPCEARGGWNEADYHTLYVPVALRDPLASWESKKMPSPFVFSTDDTVLNSYFSFAEYMATNSITNVDNIVFELGKNGGDGTHINAMIASIKADLPDVKIFVLIPAPYHATGATSGKSAQLTQDERYITLFDNREAQGIYLVPCHFNVHEKLGMRIDTRNVCQFPTIDATTETFNIDIHPSALGAMAYSYMIYNYLLYFSN